MERYGYIYGTDSIGVFGEMAMSNGIRDFVQKQGTPFPMDALERIQKIVGGFDFLPGNEQQPSNCKPVAFRYAPVRLGGKYEMLDDMKPLYALSVSGMELRMGYKKYAYDAIVLVDPSELLRKEGMNYMDHIFGTHLIGTDEVEQIRRGEKTTDPALVPERVHPKIEKNDLNAVLTILNGVFARKCVVIKLEKGQIFNERARRILEQVYGLMPPRMAIEIGFSTYQNPEQIKDRANSAPVRIFVVPGELEDVPVPEDSILVDLEEKMSPPATDVCKCLKRWSTLPWEDRYETMSRVFADPSVGIWESNKYVLQTVKFFADPFFKYKPVAGSCDGLESLKAEYDRFAVLGMDIRWVRQRFIKMIPTLLGGERNLLEMKAQIAAKLSEAGDESARKQYMALYRFANKMDESDASLFTVLQAAEMVRQKESQLKLEAEAALAAALAAQKAEFEKQLKEKDEACAKKVQEANARKDQAVKEANAQKDKALKEANAQKDKAVKEANDRKNQALQDAKNQKEQALKEAKARNDKALADQKEAQKQELQKMTAAHNAEMDQLKREMAAEIQKVKDSVPSHVTVAPTADGKQVEELKKRIAELTAANNTQIAKLKETHAKELQALKEAHAKELAQKPKATQTVVVNQNASAQEISDKTKQVLAAQLLRNLGQMEQMKARYQAEISALKNT